MKLEILLTERDDGKQDDVKRTMEAHPPLQICELAPRRTSSTTFSAYTDGSIRGVPSLPLARPDISFSMLLYTEVGGSLKFSPVESVFVLTAPVFTVTTFTPKGSSSSRRVSDMAVIAALEPV